MLIVVHLPKAGGNSVLGALSKAYGDALVWDYAEDPALPESPRNIDPTGYFNRIVQIAPGTRCIHGHFHVNKYRDVVDACRVTIMRHPVDTVFSIYFFFKSLPQTVGGSLLRYVVDKDLSIVEMAQLPLLRRLLSDTYFGGVDMRSFDFIGRHEKRDETLEALSKLINLDLDRALHANRTPESDVRRELESDATLRGRLSDLLADDLRFYERFAFRDL